MESFASLYHHLDLIQLLVNAVLVGLIWTIQLIHYPAFLYVDKTAFVAFEAMHVRKITWLVAPLMITEALTAGLLVHLSGFALEFVLAMLIVILIWASTFLLSVPCHRILAREKDINAIQRLIRTNWIRTFFWTLKFVLLLVM